MSLREGYPEPGLPTTHYFLSLSRGDAIRTVTLRPTGLWTIAALANTPATRPMIAPFFTPWFLPQSAPR